MLQTLKNALKVKEIRIKILITIALLLVYRLGCFLVIPGINSAIFTDNVNGNDFLSLLSSLSGGALSKGAFLALGVSPYISATIIVQLLSAVIPSLERLTKQGEDGRKKINQITKFVGLALALGQSIAIVVSFGSEGLSSTLFGVNTPVWLAGAFVALMLTTGAMFTFWLGEKVTDLGIGNGLSLLIFVGILSSAGQSIYSVISTIASGVTSKIWELLIFILAVVIIFAAIVFIDLAERKIPVNYARQIKGRKMYGGQSTYIPVKVLGGGVMPIIFAMAFITFPQLIMSIFWPTSGAYNWYATWLGAGSWVYSIVIGIFILFFAFFYSQMTFNPEDISKQIQQNGGFVTGIRPGKPTANYLKKINNRIVLFGAIFLAIIAVVPSLIFKAIGSGDLTNTFTATGLLIVVSVALELEKQLEAQLLMRNYRGFLK